MLRTRVAATIEWKSAQECPGEIQCLMERKTRPTILKQKLDEVEEQELSLCALSVNEIESRDSATKSLHQTEQPSWWDFQSAPLRAPDTSPPAKAHGESHETPAKPSQTRSHGSASDPILMQADLLESKLWDDSRGRMHPGFFHVSCPGIEELRRELSTALIPEENRTQRPKAASPVLRAMQVLQTTLNNGENENGLQEALVDLCNHAAAYLHCVYSSTSLRGNLFEVTATQPLGAKTDARPHRTSRHKPDAVVKKKDGLPSATLTWKDVAVAIEVKPKQSHDLGDDVVKQVMRYAWHIMQANSSAARVISATLCGPIFRLWVFDALCFGCSVGINLQKLDSMEDLASALGLLVGPLDALLPTWSPRHGQTLDLIDKTRKSQASLVLHRPCSISTMHSDGLWGRSTRAWASKAETEDGSTIQCVIKACWLPEFLKDHEALMYTKLGKVENMPELLGIACNISLPNTFALPRPTHSEALQASLLESLAQELQFVVLVIKCEVGVSIPAVITERQQVCILRDLFFILKELGLKGLHYRDLNLGNFTLKAKWEQEMEAGRNAVLLFDLDGSRFLKERRGGSTSMTARRIPLGLDDATSVNLYTLSTRAVHRLQIADEVKKWLSVKSKATSGGSSTKNADRHLERLRTKLLSCDHRYIDDAEAVVWCHLLLLRTSTQELNAETSEQIDLLHTSAKTTLWEEGWDLFVEEARAPMSGQWVDLMLEVKEAIEICEDEYRENADGTISSMEVEAYDRLAVACDTYLRCNEKVKPSSSPRKKPVRSPLSLLAPAKVNLANAKVPAASPTKISRPRVKKNLADENLPDLFA
ncbi:unnamed protein product [Sympodiomycopsis kandeliae]